MREIIVLAGSTVGSILSVLEQIKNETKCISYVVCMNSDRQTVFSSSNFVDFSYTLHYKNEEQFFEIFKDWFSNVDFINKPVVYFTSDTSCYLINKNREWFESNCLLCLPSADIISTYTEKGIAEKAAEENGLLIPMTSPINKEEDLKLIVSSFQFPVIIKPQSTYQKQRAPFKVKVLDREVFYETTKDYLKQGYNFVCQEYIPGGDEKAYFYIFYRSKQGIVNSISGRKILQNPPRAGIMAKGVVENNLDLAKQCNNFLERINYKGIGGIEFKKHKGRYYFIEMSTRLEGFFKISTIANVPLGAISYQDLIGGNVKSIHKQKDGGVYIDFLSMLVAHKKERTYGALLSDLWNLIFNKNTQLNVYSKNDKKPFFAMLKSYLK